MIISGVSGSLDRVSRPSRMGRVVPSLMILAFLGVVSSFLILSKTPPSGSVMISNQEQPSTSELVSTPVAQLPVDFYTTNFAAAENPMSEGGLWVNGRSTGLDWRDVATTPGKAFGTQSGSSGTYDDTTAVLKGTFGPNQEASATVFNNDAGGDWNGEVELRLRTNVGPHSITGYEIEFRARPGQAGYCDIVRWNGALGDFTPLVHVDGSSCGVGAGDVVRATIIGNSIMAYRNDVLVMQATDSTFGAGNPGVGFFLHNFRGSGNAADFGFSSFMARTIQ